MKLSNLLLVCIFTACAANTEELSLRGVVSNNLGPPRRGGGSADYYDIFGGGGARCGKMAPNFNQLPDETASKKLRSKCKVCRRRCAREDKKTWQLNCKRYERFCVPTWPEEFKTLKKKYVSKKPCSAFKKKDECPSGWKAKKGVRKDGEPLRCAWVKYKGCVDLKAPKIGIPKIGIPKPRVKLSYSEARALMDAAARKSKRDRLGDREDDALVLRG